MSLCGTNRRALPARPPAPFCIDRASRSLSALPGTTTHDFIIENADGFCKTFPPKFRKSLCGYLCLTVKSDAFLRPFVKFLSILSGNKKFIRFRQPCGACRTGFSAQMAAKPAAAAPAAIQCRPASNPRKFAANGNVRLPTLCPRAKKP